MSSARAIVIAALLLAPATALAQFGPDGFSTHLIVGGAPAFSFTAPAAGDYASLTANTGQTISCSRSSTATVQTSSTTIASVASGHCAVDYRGLQVEGASTNLFLQSGNLANAVWPAGATASVGTAPDGTNSLTRINGACQFQNGLFSTTATYTVSAWIQPDGANATGGVYHYCGSGGAVSICACTTSNGTACTADKTALSGAICKGYATVAGPTRLMLTASCSSVGTGVGDAVCSGPSYPGSSTILAWGAQLEQQPGATSYIATTSTSAARAADNVTASVTIPAAAAFCASGTANLNFVNSGGFNTLAFQNAGSSTAWVLDGDSTPHSRLNVFFGGSHAGTGPSFTTGASAHLRVYSSDTAHGTVCTNGTCTTTTLTAYTPVQTTSLQIGDDLGTGAELNGFLASLRVGTSPGACP